MAMIRNHKKNHKKHDNNSKIMYSTILQFGEITHNHFKCCKLSNPESSKNSSPSNDLTVHYIYNVWFIDLILQQSYCTAAHIMEWLQMTLLSTVPLSTCQHLLYFPVGPDPSCHCDTPPIYFNSVGTDPCSQKKFKQKQVLCLQYISLIFPLKNKPPWKSRKSSFDMV